MNVTILSVDVKTVPTAKGSYQTVEVAYKNNTFQGKVEGKKVFSFGVTAKSFQTLSQAVAGESYEVETVKNDKGYLDWTIVNRSNATAGVPEGTIAPSTASSKAVASPKSTYETSEERAQRQVLIVRQSSISNAISTLSVGAKTVPKSVDVIALAREYEDYVFGKTGAEGSGFEDMSNDFPDVEA